MPFPLVTTKNIGFFNTRIKYDCFGNVVEVISFPVPVLNPLQYEAQKDNKPKEQMFDDVENDVDNSGSHEGDFRRCVNKARNRIRDLIYSNEDLTNFVTLTLNKEKVNRYDYNQVIAKYNSMLSNYVQRKALKYVLVPELHKDGAIHFHGFINDALTLTNSRHKNKNGQTVYNIEEYGLGYSTAVKINDNRQACANYILKYITKQLVTGKIGGRYYLHGGDLAEPHAVYCYVPYESIDVQPVTVRDGVSFKIWTPERAYASGSQFSIDNLYCQIDGERAYAK